jgi:RimJ/RimL family protein N-acetyltransferase
MIEIVSGAVKLRQHQIGDLEDIHLWENDPELLVLNSETEAPWSRDETSEHLVRWISSHERRLNSLYFAVCSESDDKLIGFAALALIDPIHDRCRVAVTIGDRSYWGKGYGFHTLFGLLVFAFSYLRLHRVVAEVYDFNERALALVKKLGFEQEGQMRENVWKRGRWSDELVFGLLRREFEARTRPLAGARVSLDGVWGEMAHDRALDANSRKA